MTTPPVPTVTAHPEPDASPSSPPADRAEARARFLEVYPEYESTDGLDRLRSEEFSRLDEQGHVYLDYTGGGLYGASQIERHKDLLLSQVFGNPHSSNPTSLATTDLVESCRRHVLDYFGASPEEYVVIFTANASHALKLVGESYPFDPEDRFLLTFDNHNSVNGIREYDRAHGAQTTYVPVLPPELRVEPATLERHLDRARPDGHNLFAYPAQSNFSGVQHPLEWIELAHAKGWDVLLDAAAFVPTNRLDLSRWKPDYVALSFYKMFGYPTGVGALLGRREALAKLHRPWFAGGTISMASVQADLYSMAAGAAAFEDGTLNYEILPAVDFGLDFLEGIGVDVIHERVRCLTGWLLDALLSLRHDTGEPLAILYGPAGTEDRGGTITLNFRDRDGNVIDHEEVERQANARKISLRTGCFCNPGAGEVALGLSGAEISGCFSRSGNRMTYDDFRRCVNDKSTGAVRVSVGMVTNFEDVFTFIEFARSLLDR
ncbi:MAG: aminotransferase class V-fold PLP-dependent enzyme [Acidobacteriota bacterium]|jgi:selenocysteine lyase/cysteine desulfurase